MIVFRGRRPGYRGGRADRRAHRAPADARMSFAEDTALVPAGENGWRGEVHERWWVVKGPFGGTVAALLTRALMQVTEHPPRTLAVHYADAPAAGAVDISAAVE